MRMCAEESRDTAVGIESECSFFSGGLRMKIDDFYAAIFEFFYCFVKAVKRVGVA